MAKSDSTICFRVPMHQRNLLEAVAHYADQTLSDFARENLVQAADAIIRRVGVEAVMEKDREFEERRQSEAAARLRARQENLGRANGQ
ncbi:MAG: hypothetical protein AB7J32_08530 [Pseudonocardia sp.]